MCKITTLKNTKHWFIKTSYRLMQVKSIAECLSTFITLPFVIKVYVLSIFEWPFNTGFTMYMYQSSVKKIHF